MIKGTGGVSTNLIYWLAFVIGIGSIFLMRRVLRSKLGLGLAAIRDNERTAASCGVSVFKLKLYTFVIAALGHRVGRGCLLSLSGIHRAIRYV